MAASLRAQNFLLALIFLGSIYENQCQAPKLEVSKYRAVGEIFDVKSQSQIYFEENWDEASQKLSVDFNLKKGSMLSGPTVKYLELQNLKQSFIYTAGGKSCEKEVQKKWDQAIPQSRSLQGGISVYSIQQLINLKEGTSIKMNKQGSSTKYRGISAKVWSYKFKDDATDLEVEAYWSDGSNTGPSAVNPVPLAYIVKKLPESATIMTINVFLFSHMDVNITAIQAIRGTHCEGLGEAGKFPEVSSLPGLSYRTEILMEDFLTIAIVDAWIDPKFKLYRVDYLPYEKFNIPVSSSTKRIVSLDQNVVYTTAEFKSTVSIAWELEEDPQLLINPKYPEQLNVDAWFGVKSTSYMEIGDTLERGAPCKLYHGIRTDWPKDRAKTIPIETLWEWCIAEQSAGGVKFPGRRYPIVSLNVYVLKSNDTLYYEGFRMTYSFHQALDEAPFFTNLATFDVSDAFQDENKMYLEFSVKVLDEDREIFKQSLNNPELIWKFKEAIFNATELRVSSLRISDFQVRDSTSVAKAEDKGVIVLFTLLGIHPNLPAGVETVNLNDAKSNLASAIDSDQFKLEINYDEKKVLKITGEPNSLREQPITAIINLPIVPDDALRYGAGTMAAVAIVMLLLGFSVGAGGFFVKKRYIDKGSRAYCLR